MILFEYNAFTNQGQYVYDGDRYLESNWSLGGLRWEAIHGRLLTMRSSVTDLGQRIQSHLVMKWRWPMALNR